MVTNDCVAKVPARVPVARVTVPPGCSAVDTGRLPVPMPITLPTPEPTATLLWKLPLFPTEFVGVYWTPPCLKINIQLELVCLSMNYPQT